jgi:hypothetical protein
LHGEEHRREVGDHLLEHIGLGRAQRCTAGDAGIDEQDVVLAEFFRALADRSFGGGDVGDVSLKRECVRSEATPS